MARPILKWAGGKQGLLSDIVALFPDDFRERRFHEPFFGGGAVTFWVEPKEGTINDINPRLMRFYRVVRDEVEELIEDAKKHKNEEEYYYKMRDEFNSPITEGRDLSDVREASLLLYLNKTCYNGLYRVNSKGEFNVPFGRYKNPNIVPEKRLREASRVLKRLKLHSTDFEYILDVAEEGDLVYFDPPYQPISKTACFTDYSEGGFSLDDQKRLRDACTTLHENGVYFVLSNSFSSSVSELYGSISDFEVLVVEAMRYINCDPNGRGATKELLITNVPLKERVGVGRSKVMVGGNSAQKILADF